MLQCRSGSLPACRDTQIARHGLGVVRGAVDGGAMIFFQNVVGVYRLNSAIKAAYAPQKRFVDSLSKYARETRNDDFVFNNIPSEDVMSASWKVRFHGRELDKHRFSESLYGNRIDPRSSHHILYDSNVGIIDADSRGEAHHP